ncbi:hypothetical protein PHYBOEH_004127 [Phytophthora boehmeriae]|uniref:Uncharacterized protein n=1 Tax=Phytophthora boehmeriae TaxID=109152 RepID=A0A8T1WMG7_9STRA|nr:hypothetical protein PHYBOEH_004127 [Phytophthora boehmeriae]
MADALKHLQEQLHVNMERQGLIQLVESKLDAFKSATTAQVNQVKSAAKRKAKTLVRRHHSEEYAAHEEITGDILKVIAEYKESTVAAAAVRTEELLQAFSKCNETVQAPAVTTDQNSDPLRGVSPAQVDCLSNVTSPAVSDQGNDDVDDDDDDDDDEEDSSSSSSSSEEEKQTSNQDTPVVIDSSTLELLQMLRAAQAITQPPKPDRQALEKVSRAEQRKVAAGANARARNLTDKKKRASSQKPKETAMSAHQKLMLQAKLTTEARKTKKKKAEDALKKKKAEDAFKLAELLLKQML